MKGRRDKFDLDGATASKLQMIRLYCQNLPTSQVHQSPFTNHQSPITIRKVLDEGASQW
jgi:hypothetical protein